MGILPGVSASDTGWKAHLVGFAMMVLGSLGVGIEGGLESIEGVGSALGVGVGAGISALRAGATRLHRLLLAELRRELVNATATMSQEFKRETGVGEVQLLESLLAQARDRENGAA